MKTFSWCLNTGKLKTEQKLIFLPCLHVFSPPYLFRRTIGTQSHLAKFLNWGNHVNLVPDFAASPPDSGYLLFNSVPNYTKIKGLDSEKITSCQNVFNSRASFQSSPKINGMLITRLICIQWKSSRSYPQFPWSPLGTPGTSLFARDQQKKDGCIFRVSLKEARLIT